MRHLLLLPLLCCLASPALAHPSPPLASAHVLVVEDGTGEPLLSKDADVVVPMASLTKLITAMVVLDAGQRLDEPLQVTDDDLDRLKHTRRGLSVGTVLTRQDMLDLALQASDNRAASALARHYPGGLESFLHATARKAQALGLRNTVVVEPTGLSPENRSSAADLALLLKAVGAYPLIEAATRSASRQLWVQGRLQTVRNTNPLVGRDGWDIQLSKTGFTNEAGRCLAMRLQEAGRVVRVVLLGGSDSQSRTQDMRNIRRYLRGEPALAEVPHMLAVAHQGGLPKPRHAKPRKLPARPVV